MGVVLVRCCAPVERVPAFPLPWKTLQHWEAYNDFPRNTALFLRFDNNFTFPGIDPARARPEPCWRDVGPTNCDLAIRNPQESPLSPRFLMTPLALQRYPAPLLQ